MARGPMRGRGGKGGPKTRYPTTPVVAGIQITSALAPNIDVAQTYTLTGSILSGDIPLVSEPDGIGVDGLNGRTVTFTSSDVTKATVTASTTSGSIGVFSATVTGAGAGTATITVACEGVSDSSVVCTVTSPQNAVASVTVTPSSNSGDPGAVLQFAAVVKDAGGNTLTGKTVTWSEVTGPTLITTGADSGTEAHTVNVTLVSAGSASIKATSDAVDSSPATTITVNAAGTLYFADKMDDGVKHSGSGWSWTNNTNITVQTIPEALPGGLTTTHALRFTYGNGNTEQRFVMGNNLTEVYVGFYIHYPSNYFHRNGPSSDNNKFFRIWSGDTTDGNAGYTRYAIKGGFSTRPTPAAAGGGSTLENEYGWSNSSCGQSSVTWAGSTSGEVFLDAVGAWYKIILRLKISSAAAVADGALEAYINDVLKVSKTDRQWYPLCVGGGGESTAYFNRGYILGAANSGWNEQQDVYVTRVRFGSTQAIADPDNTTGWLT